MEETNNTEDRILFAFLRLAAEHGIDAVTTREVASAAGVNPVTLFRRFGDKQTIALKAIRRFCPVPTLPDWEPVVDPANAQESLLSCLLFFTNQEQTFPAWFHLGLRQVSSMPEVQAEVNAKQNAAYRYLRSALSQVAPALRPEVDHHVTVLQWLGLLAYAAGEPEPAEWRALFEASIRPLLRDAAETRQ